MNAECVSRLRPWVRGAGREVRGARYGVRGTACEVRGTVRASEHSAKPHLSKTGSGKLQIKNPNLVPFAQAKLFRLPGTVLPVQCIMLSFRLAGSSLLPVNSSFLIPPSAFICQSAWRESSSLILSRIFSGGRGLLK
jgi:hypothetical protein